mmetsp:Transcript_14945/g.22485  ORF Transcript_14945/g.22485 Transcript_14945/m.22485 type:complete len:190 (-) Transcript_14945:250-819(-)|eukprot:CAMPEP_0185025080 /NCGR_PEP_ID=MMETSP1103-20130426/8176_1 /TAXON_ID=36769 /ORGANISM="Paraphysomonas bandaiensis, Strain Caron Lab Isolate" /LENGTH=189 /DNA_ID=CAMNT_0027558199 /DNA_START=141 /DNA_END=710 /DNA_ORIENTATION=-
MVPFIIHTTEPDSQYSLHWSSHILQYCTLKDVLALSAASKQFSNLALTRDVAQYLITNDPIASKLDPQFLDLKHLTLSGLRIVLYRLVVGVTDTESRLDQSGSFVAGCFCDSASQESEEVFVIEKHLESSSFDEYDDFNPRHPDYKSHRRGGSFFNSDISDVAAQVVAEDLSLIAKMALDSQDDDDAEA